MTTEIEAARTAAQQAARRWRTELRGRTEPPLHRTHLVASYTPHQAVAGLALGRLDAGTPTDVVVADVNQLFQVAMDPAAHDIDPADDVVVLWRIEDVMERTLHDWSLGDTTAFGEAAGTAASLGRALSALIERQRGTVVISDAPVPVGFGFDHRDSAEAHELRVLAHHVSEQFLDAVAHAPNLEILRLSALQATWGLRATFDSAGWMMYRQPHPDWFSHVVGSEVAALLAARTRAAPKVLVLDCDGTLWDGVAVDDGIGGLRCDDAFPGRAHQEFQRAVQRLRARGIMLALSSKNDPDTVAEAFADVDGMVLTDADIATRRVSWNPKPSEIAEIVAELNIGADSVVFVDDSPFEIGSVQTQFPAVRCLRVPDDVEDLPDLLADTGWFRHLRVSDDDRRRTEMIRAEAARTAAAPTMSHEEFLASLDLTVDVVEVGRGQLERAAQLINKSNQFNLTTIRRDTAAVDALATSPSSVVLAASVTDRFGDYGIVGVMIASIDGDMWSIDTLVMSCRVLGRGVETAMLALLVERLRRDGPAEIVGTYRPTDRNARVAELYPDHGFDPADSGDAGTEYAYRLPAGRTVEVPTHIGARWIDPTERS